MHQEKTFPGLGFGIPVMNGRVITRPFDDQLVLKKTKLRHFYYFIVFTKQQHNNAALFIKR